MRHGGFDGGGPRAISRGGFRWQTTLKQSNRF